MSRKKEKNSKKKQSSAKQEYESDCEKSKTEKIGETKLIEDSVKANNTDKRQIFFLELEKVTKDLIYISETDAEVLPFVGGKLETLNSEALLEQTNTASDKIVKEINFEDFFENLITIQDWFEEEEKEKAEKFLKLKKLLEENLKDLKVFKIGKIEIEIYVVGLDEENNILGIKTEAVET